MRVSILGSCITRDVFRLFPDDAAVVSYHSRSSLISVMARPLAVVDTGLEWPSGFARNVVLADFRKTFFTDLEAAAPDLLIIDLLSERFDLLCAAGSVVTRSWDLVQSGFDRRSGYRFERVAREAGVVHATWFRRAEEFIRQLRLRFPQLPVVVHKAYWTSMYRDGPALRRFPRAWQRSILLRNEFLSEYYESLERLRPDVVSIEPRRDYVADANHRWGLGASHYEHAYYEDVRAQLRVPLSSRSGALAA